MKIDEQFNLVAREYDENRRLFIPCFDEFYQGTTDFIVKSIDSPRRVIDLGAGTGLLTSFWYAKCPGSNYMLVDVAEQMLEMAKERFRGVPNVTFEALDYRTSLPDTEFDAVISALSIHHLEHQEKRELFRRIYGKLPPGGIFVNYDQFCAGTEAMSAMLDRYWVDGLEHSGLSEQDIAKWQQRKAFDRECSVSDEIAWLRQAGFGDVQCVYTHQKFSVILAIK